VSPVLSRERPGDVPPVVNDHASSIISATMTTTAAMKIDA
jgi:hypothetical protein